ncbi:MAG: FG-GAP-like repeat-containing protein [Myxococcota bacterium]
MALVRGFSFVLMVGFLAACSGKPDVPITVGNGGKGGASGSGGAAPGSGGTIVDIPDAGAGGEMMGTGGSMPDPCAGLLCGKGQRCELVQGVAACVDNTCADLKCGALEECVPAVGGGFVCNSLSCKSDVECSEARHCDGTKCVDDVCEPETRACDGDDVLLCASNGGANPPAYTCGGGGYFTSKCSDKAGATGQAIGCTCEGDWDCPQFTICEAGVCKGTGVEPTCTLPPARFEDVLPKLEFRWGGTNQANPKATGRAFPWSAQVASTPMVVNLDDDNGDGLINELDFAEIVFMSYDTAVESRGIVRAIHAGGPNKGKDYFALCGATLWKEGNPLISDCAPGSGNAESRDAAIARASGAVAAGDLDGDGKPEIVVPLQTGALQILDNTGAIVATSASGLWPAVTSMEPDWRYPAPAIANLDYAGFSEIVMGNRVLTLKSDAGKIAFDKVFTGQFRTGTMHHGTDEQHHGPTVCMADLTENPGLEIVAGTSLYRLPDVANCTTAPNSDYCLNRLTSVWNAETANAGATFYAEGFCAVADVLGADTVAAPGPGNDLDRVPEVLVMADGHLLVLQASNGKLLRDVNLGGGIQGGAPNIDDFDGDGFPEIAIALSDFYAVVDLQAANATNCPAWNNVLSASATPPGTNPPRNPGGSCTQNSDCNAGAVCNQKAGTCVCLQSGWKRDTEDDSSKVTSSSVFDFNGDGAAEVVYNDECYFHVYDGATGGLYLALPSLSRTIIENPVVADVDNDGNAEIVFVQNNETIQCSESNLDSWPNGSNDVAATSLPNGIEVWGDPSDVWVAARRVWNQHSYHVTNVTEGGQIPLHEPEHFRPLNGRLYNTYRSQPRNYGVAPDLTPIAIQVSSPDVACGQLSSEIQVSVQVKNAGDLRVGPGVQIAFAGRWASPNATAPLLDVNGDPITVTLDKSLEPGATTIVSISYTAGNNGRPDLPIEVSASVDAAAAERECHEDNNDIVGPVEAGATLADLSIAINSAVGCSPPKASVTVTNQGSAPAADILVRIYAGDPSRGGQILGETIVPGPLAPGESVTISVTLETLYRNVVLYGVLDPLNTVTECNDANNVTQGPELRCEILR